MKKVYTISVITEQITQMDKILNTLRIDLNDRDRSKTFNLNGCEFVVYTVLCDDNTYTTIVNYLNKI